MKKTNESGHAKNVANLGKLIAFVDAFGTVYNPSRTALTAPNLKTLEADSKNAIDAVLSKLADYDDAVNQRHLLFSNLKKRATRIMAALKSVGTSAELFDDAKGFNRKIQGQRASKITTNPDPNATPQNKVSVSQQSYDLLIQHLKGLIVILKNEPNYAPNEDDLKINNLEDYAIDLFDKNKKVADAIAAIGNARRVRNEVLYDAHTGLYDQAMAVKLYVKSLFGSKSAQYAQVSGLRFTPKKN